MNMNSLSAWNMDTNLPTQTHTEIEWTWREGTTHHMFGNPMDMEGGWVRYHSPFGNPMVMDNEY